MVNYNTKNSLGSLITDFSLFVAGTYYETLEVLLDPATAGYVPAVGDVLTYVTDDSNKHQKYDPDDADQVIMGVICEIKADNTTPTAVTKLSYAINASVHYAALGYIGTLDAAEKLALANALRAKNINLVD